MENYSSLSKIVFYPCILVTATQLVLFASLKYSAYFSFSPWTLVSSSPKIKNLQQVFNLWLNKHNGFRTADFVLTKSNLFFNLNLKVISVYCQAHLVCTVVKQVNQLIGGTAYKRCRGVGGGRGWDGGRGEVVVGEGAKPLAEWDGVTSFFTQVLSHY